MSGSNLAHSWNHEAPHEHAEQQRGPQSLRARAWEKISRGSPLFWLAAAGCLTYCVFFYRSISEWWFNPIWTTDDALQQSYPFLKVLNPDLFEGDIITLMMESYLTPLHYWLSVGITHLTQDPIMTGHWVMLIQLLVTVGFIFGAVRYGAGVIPALFSVAWFLHTRHVVQRLTAGLPRGWAAPLFAAFFYFALKGSPRGVFATIMVGCLLHPPATVIFAASYGLYLLIRYTMPSTRAAFKRPLVEYLVLCPIFFLTAFYVTRMPEEIGTMATYEVASQMPEFSTPFGRFPFVPHRDAGWEIRTFGFQAFLMRFYNPGRFWKSYLPEFILVFSFLLLGIAAWKKRAALPLNCLLFLVCTLGIYFLSRELAFKLYVPNRHLQFPCALFFIVTLPILVWRALIPERSLGSGLDVKFSRVWPGVLGLLVLGTLIACGSGDGFKGSANFNYALDKKGRVFEWIKKFTPPDSLIAGEPTHIDAMQLFGQRQAFITTETAHPFYDKYYQAIKPRVEISLRAHYARSFEEFLSLVEPAGIDYFVFQRKSFYPEALAKATYWKPFDDLIRELVSRDVMDYAFRSLPREVNLETFPPMVFRDEQSVVIDVHALSTWVQEQKRS